MVNLQLASGLLLISLIPIIITSNLLVILLLARLDSKKRKYRIFNFMQWLSFADLGVGLMSVLPGVLEEFNENRMLIPTNFACKTQRFIQAITLLLSVYIKLALGLDRYIFLIKVGNQTSCIWKTFSKLGAFRLAPKGLCAMSLAMAAAGSFPQVFVWKMYEYESRSIHLSTNNATQRVLEGEAGGMYSDMCYLALDQSGRFFYNLYFIASAFFIPLCFYIFSWSHIICTLYPGRIKAPPSPFVSNLRRKSMASSIVTNAVRSAPITPSSDTASQPRGDHRARSASAVRRAALNFRKRGSQMIERLLHWSVDSSVIQQANNGACSIEDNCSRDNDLTSNNRPSSTAKFGTSDECFNWNNQHMVCDDQLKQERQRFLDNCTALAGNEVATLGHTPTSEDYLQSQLRRARRKATKMTVVTIVTYILCWSPFALATIYITIDFNQYYTSSMKPIIKFGALLFSLNSCTNPWIYLVFSRSLRNALKQIARKPIQFCK